LLNVDSKLHAIEVAGECSNDSQTRRICLTNQLQLQRLK
jgi:hypothetical protein